MTRSLRSIIVLVAVFAACDDGASESDALRCPAGTAAFRAPDAATLGADVVVAEWCRTPAGVASGPYRLVDETGIGTQGEGSERVPGPVVLVTGQFDDGLAQGVWRRWQKRYYAANFTLELIVEESWERGLADGTWHDRFQGAETGTRTYRGGIACGTWTSSGGAIDYLPCDEVGLVDGQEPTPPPDDPLGAPVTIDFGWDGVTCPDGSRPVPEPVDVRALACWKDGLRDGPYGRWFGAPGAPFDDKRDDGAYAAGKRTGTWRGWHGNGILAYQGEHGADGERAGSWRSYFADGWLFERADFVAGLRDGAVETYHDGGHAASVEAWREGFRHGAYASWRADGAQVYDGTYERGLMHGDWTVWSDEWGPRAKTLQHWAHGVAIGTWSATYEVGGEPAWSVSFVDGRAEGTSTQWWQSGHERTIGQYAAGLRWGVWRTFYEDGTLQSEVTYVADHLTGPAKTWHPDGSPASEGVYEHDERAYTWTVWDEDGDPITCTYPWPGDPACP